ncbi:Uncharacterised protein [Mycobacteroides abscessus subsp. abscessus]|nr:Uncharacterised protein [Mycobacteroides abscessus subsp. abscessus]
MSLRAERSSTIPEGVRRGRQRLPVPVSPMCSETLNSYLRRVTDQNLLRPGWLSQLSRQPHFVANLVELTGLTERGLVAAAPGRPRLDAGGDSTRMQILRCRANSKAKPSGDCVRQP